MRVGIQGAAIGQRHRMGVLQDGAGVEQSHSRLLQVAPVDGLQAGHLGVASGLELRPIKTARAQGPAKTRCLFKLLGEARGVHHQLLGHTPAYDAGATHAVLLDQGHTRAVVGGNAAARTPGTTATTTRS